MGVAQVVPMVPVGTAASGLWHCPSLGPVSSWEWGRHQPLLSHGAKNQWMSHGCPCLSLQTSSQFNGELSKQSGTINGKDGCVPLASFCRGTLTH